MRKIEAAVLAILLGAITTPLYAAPAPATDTTMPTDAAATTAVTPPSAYAAVSGCGGACERGGSCLHRLIGWATYCPKERLGCCKTCNCCEYKGALPIYLITGRYCQEGSGIQPTFSPNCCHGCKGCSSGAP